MILAAFERGEGGLAVVYYYGIFLALVIIGALNWGLVGFFNYDLVAAIFGGNKHPNSQKSSRVVYGLVGLSAIALIIILLV